MEGPVALIRARIMLRKHRHVAEDPTQRIDKLQYTQMEAVGDENSGRQRGSRSTGSNPLGHAPDWRHASDWFRARHAFGSAARAEASAQTVGPGRWCTCSP